MGSDRIRDETPVGRSTQSNFICRADMRAHHLIIFVVGLFVVLAGFDAALTAFAHSTLKAASQSAPPVAPLLFGRD